MNSKMQEMAAGLLMILGNSILVMNHVICIWCVKLFSFVLLQTGSKQLPRDYS